MSTPLAAGVSTLPWVPIGISDDEAQRGFVRRNRKKARFLVDESLGIAVSDVLRRSGWNTRYVGEVGLEGRADEDVLAFAQRDDRVLLTHDMDFLNDRRFPPHRNPGVVVLPGNDGNRRVLLTALRRMLAIVGTFREVWRGTKLVFGIDGEIKSKHRDMDTGRMRTTRYRFTQRRGPEMWEP